MDYLVIHFLFVMKYSTHIGIFAAVALIAFCFAPWVYISSIQTTVTGLETGNTNYGKPGVVHIFFSIVSIILFLTPRVWAKRTNLLVGSFNFVWAIRNFLVITLCQMGECPQ